MPPETRFTGLALAGEDVRAFPQRIRLGSFRGVAWLELDAAESVKAIAGPALADHLVDPLVSPPVRGVMVNLFPYPLVMNAVCPKVFQLKFQGSSFGPERIARLGWPKGYTEPPQYEREPRGPVAIF